MKCLILAAGYATRLYPLTENFPKPLLKVKDKTILDWLIEDIDTAKLVDEYIVISNDKFYNHFFTWSKTKKQRIVVLNDKTTCNENRLGAVKDIEFAIDSLNLDDDLLVIAGDNLLDFSLTEFIYYSKDKNASCIMRYYESDIKKLQKTGVIEIDEYDKVLNMVEKPSEPKSNYACPPFYYYKSSDAKLISKAIKDGCNVDAPGSFIVWLCKKSTVYAMQMSGKRYDIGNLESYNLVQQIYKGVFK